MLTAKLFVPLGAPDQESAGDTFWPVQPQLLKTCSSAIFPPAFTSGLVRVIAGAALAPARPATARMLKAANTLIVSVLPNDPPDAAMAARRASDIRARTQRPSTVSK